MPHASCVEPFREVVSFRHRPSEYCGYGSLVGSTGKSIGVLCHAGLVPLGPHHFGTCEPAGLAAGRAGLVAGRAARQWTGRGQPMEWPRKVHTETALMPPPVAVVLHFHCPSLDRWQSKYADHLASLRQLGSGHEASHGTLSLDELVRASEGWSFHEASCAVATLAVALSRSSSGDEGDNDEGNTVNGDDGEAASAFRRVWEHWKLQPAGLPKLSDHEEYRVLSDGVTLVRLPTV